MPLTLIVDIDGTLVDTNYHHAIAWQRAFRANRHQVPAWKIHRHVGMGGDQFVPAVLSQDVDDRQGEELREGHSEAYMEMIEEVEPLPGARELLQELHEDELGVVLASSAKQEEVDHYLDLLGARELVTSWTTSADVEKTKPEPDLVAAAMEKSGGDGPWLMIGDSVWDVRAAANADVPTLGVLSGGFSEEELREAGAAAVVESVEAIRHDAAALTALARPAVS
ncbi:MAG TPA: HAD family hydrolase [Solirubrobacterales bacterium]|nr:HAD family hydrolase [Solirubrobacterales bacterium]